MTRTNRMLSALLLIGFAGLAGCASDAAKESTPPADESATPAPAPAPDLAGSSWAVTTIEGDSVVAGSEVTIAFAADGQASGNATCNNYNGKYTLEGANLTFGPTMSTLRACLEEGKTAQEAKFLGALAKVATWSIMPDDGLVLTTSEGKTITARRG